MSNEQASTGERWLPILGYEGYYEVSDQGRVRSLDRLITNSRCTRMYKGQLLSQRQQAQGGQAGYLQVSLCVRSRPQYVRVHRLVLTAFVGPCPDRMECCHNNGNPADNRLENLRWDTKSENLRDQYRHGRPPKGSGNRGLSTTKPKPSHCRNRHELTAENTYERRNSYECKKCRYMQKQRFLQKRAAA